ncbi:MAG: hypothetical protein A2Z99_13775 [Treponema sp. GWB1_62_6]|nr:MAG: hypothetical protein A2Z99_13775 [Treponema sp. GWB1_62_6]
MLWNDIRLAQGGGAARIAEKAADRSALCVVPIIENGKYETLPTLKVPAFYRGTIRTIPFAPRVENAPTLYPFDAVGLYDMERFQRLGGFDPTIRSLYWQLMDFGFRARLWGETIRCTRAVKFAYEGEIPSENASVDEGYKVFFLKNLAPVFRGDYAHIPIRRFLPYMLRSGVGAIEAWKEFSEGRKWVATNRYRFSSDARMAIELWEAPES